MPSQKAYRVQTAELVGYFEPTLDGLEVAARTKAGCEKLKLAKIRLVDNIPADLVDGVIRTRAQASEIKDAYAIKQMGFNPATSINEYLRLAEISKGKRRLGHLRVVIAILNYYRKNPQIVSKIMSFTNLTKADIEGVADELLSHGILDPEDAARTEQLLDILY